MDDDQNLIIPSVLPNHLFRESLDLASSSANGLLDATSPGNASRNDHHFVDFPQGFRHREGCPTMECANGTGGFLGPVQITRVDVIEFLLGQPLGETCSLFPAQCSECSAEFIDWLTFGETVTYEHDLQEVVGLRFHVRSFERAKAGIGRLHSRAAGLDSPWTLELGDLL